MSDLKKKLIMIAPLLSAYCGPEMVPTIFFTGGLISSTCTDEETVAQPGPALAPSSYSVAEAVFELR